jgi:tetratricopeptide (TPR) repeat protein
MRRKELPPLDEDKILDAPPDISGDLLLDRGVGLRTGDSSRSRRTGGGGKAKILWTVIGFLLGVGVAGFLVWELNPQKTSSTPQVRTSRPILSYPVAGLKVERRALSEGQKTATTSSILTPGETVRVKYGKEHLRFLSLEREKGPWASLVAMFVDPPRVFLGEKVLKPGDDLTELMLPEKGLHYEIALRKEAGDAPLATFHVELEMTAEAWVARAKSLEDPGSQRKCLEQALSLDPGSVEVLLALGKLLWEQQDPIGAAEKFEEALKRSPNNKEAALALATLYYKSKPKRALEMYSLLAQIDPERKLEYWKKVAQLQERLGVSPVETYRKILSVNKNDSDAKEGLAQLYAKGVEEAQKAEKKGDLAKAIETMKHALELNPTKEGRAYLATLHNNLAYSLAKAGKFKEAIPHYEASLKLDESPVTLLNLADAYAKDRQDLKALKALERAWALKPKEQEVVRNILLLWAELLTAKKDFKAAISKLEELKGRFPNDPEIVKTLAIAYWHDKNLNKALELLKTVPAMMKSNSAKEKAEVHRLLGDLYRALGDQERDIKKRISRYDEALKEYKAGLALFKDKELEKRKEQLEAERLNLVKRSLRS